MRIPELEAFEAECRAIEATLAGIDPQAWSGPGLGEWTLHELTAHLVGSAARLAEYAQQPLSGDSPVCDRVEYWQMDLSAEAPAVAARARERAAGLPPERIEESFARAWTSTAQVVADRGPDALVNTLRGPMRMDDYLATRVVEVCVHHIDIRTAVDLPAAATPAASRMTMELLEALLGAPRPRNLGRVRFILAATGRVPSDDPRFPVLS